MTMARDQRVLQDWLKKFGGSPVLGRTGVHVLGIDESLYVERLLDLIIL
jgi:hypothetical protein